MDEKRRETQKILHLTPSGTGVYLLVQLEGSCCVSDLLTSAIEPALAMQLNAGGVHVDGSAMLRGIW